MATDKEIRQALTLTAADAVAHTESIEGTKREAITDLLRRLVSDDPLGVDEEAALIRSLLEAGCDTHPPFEHSFVAKFLNDRA